MIEMGFYDMIPVRLHLIKNIVETASSQNMEVAKAVNTFEFPIVKWLVLPDT